jgi:hypothetical protein
MSNRRGRPQAAMAIWSWRQDDGPPPAETSSARGIRLRGALQGALGITLASLVYLFVSQTAAWVIGSIAALVTLAALLSPERLFAKIEAGFRVLGRGLGQFLTWTLLTLIFYSFFLPFGVLFRRGRKDSMTRFYDPEAASYWLARKPRQAGIDFYKRQY